MLLEHEIRQYLGVRWSGTVSVNRIVAEHLQVFKSRRKIRNQIRAIKNVLNEGSNNKGIWKGICSSL